MLSGEVHFGASGELTLLDDGARSGSTSPRAARGRPRPREPDRRRPRCAAAFDGGGVPALEHRVRDDPRGQRRVARRSTCRREQMFLVRKEADGLNVYEEDEAGADRAVRLERHEERQGRHLQARPLPRLRVPALRPDAGRAAGLGRQHAARRSSRPRACASRPRCATGSAASPCCCRRSTGRPGTTLVSRPGRRAGAPTPCRTSGPDARARRSSRAPARCRPSTRTTSPGSYGEDREGARGAARQVPVRARRRSTQSNFGVVRFELDERRPRRSPARTSTRHPPGKHEGGARQHLPRRARALRRRAAEAAPSTAGGGLTRWRTSATTSSARRAPSSTRIEDLVDDDRRRPARPARARGRPRPAARARSTARTRTASAPPLTAIDEYINAVDADAEKLKVAIESIKAYVEVLDDGLRRGEDRGPGDRRRRGALPAVPVRDRRPDEVRAPEPRTP